MGLRVFVLAGEPSGDRLGAALMRGLKTLAPDVSFEGVGGTLMQAEGLRSQFPMEELSVMGIAEVLPKYFDLKRRIQETADAVVAMQPDVMITIDSPDFSLRVAKLVKDASDIRTVHYVAPSVWAWRPGRATKMAKVIDHVLALLPFEPPYMEAAGMECDFVGHPIATQPRATKAEADAFRAAHGIDDAPLALLLPGSRRGEVSRIAPVLADTLARLSSEVPGLRAVLPAAGPVTPMLKDMLPDWPVQPILLDPAETDDATKRAAFHAADVAVAASGTVSLELAAARTPMVIAYRMHPITFAIMQRMILTDTVTLVNLVADSRTVPEFLGPDCRADLIAPAARALLDDPTAQGEAMALTMACLGEGGEDPGLRAARAVLSRL